MEQTLSLGLGPSCPIGEPGRQEVLDAAAVLQLRRAELASAMTKGPVRGAEIVARGEGINPWMMRAAVHEWRELLSVRPYGPLAHLRISLPNNRIALAGGLRMISVFDYEGLTNGGQRLLAGERLGTYLIGIGKVQMKIVDREFVLLQGPFVEGEDTVMAVRAPACLRAAWNYWHRIMDSAYPVVDQPVTDGPQLTTRQRQILSLLATDANDDSIASALGVSVRTVRSDIAEVMRILGVRSRFSVGARLHEITEAAGAT